MATWKYLKSSDWEDMGPLSLSGLCTISSLKFRNGLKTIHRNGMCYQLLLWSRNSSVNMGMSNVGMSLSSLRCRWSPPAACYHNSRNQWNTHLKCLSEGKSSKLPVFRWLKMLVISLPLTLIIFSNLFFAESYIYNHCIDICTDIFSMMRDDSKN